nr:MAG TPA: hypothetical protein [Caudoviricetes sp.]
MSFTLNINKAGNYHSSSHISRSEIPNATYTGKS